MESCHPFIYRKKDTQDKIKDDQSACTSKKDRLDMLEYKLVDEAGKS
jgi:hypothetical protein